jgi:hypothetical protein
MAKSKATIDESEFIPATTDANVLEGYVQKDYGPATVDAAALRAYIAWGAHHSYKEPRTGSTIEPWETLTKHEQDAWRNAAFAVLTGG